MTAQLAIGRLDARYRVRGDADTARRAKAQLDRVLAEVIARGVAHALDDAGLEDDDAEVCIRELEIPLTLQLRAGEPRLVEAWSQALAEGLRHALETEDDARVVRYPSITHAIVDLVEGLMRGESRRRWAWQQLGLATHAPVPALLTSVADRPERLMPVLRTLAARGTLSALAARMDDDAWVALAATALEHAGQLDGWALLEGPLDGDVGSARPIASAAPLASAMIARVTRESRLLPALGIPALTSRGCRAQAALVLLEAAPHGLAQPERATRIEDLAAHLATRRESARASTSPRLDTAAASSRIEPDNGPIAASERRDEVTPDVRADGDPPPTHDGTLLATAPLASPAWHTRARAATRHGGLLYLLHVVGELQVPAALTAHVALASRSLRWSLHQLALALAPVDARNPAALAFAGLGPDEAPPGTGEPPASDAERAALADIARGVLERAADRIGDASPSALSDLCRRDAWIVADPGWLEAHMKLTEVSTAIRRSGLDCNPDHVAWLGVVVRFVYA